MTIEEAIELLIKTALPATRKRSLTHRVLDVLAASPALMGWIIFALGCVFGIGLARIVLALASIQ